MPESVRRCGAGAWLLAGGLAGWWAGGIPWGKRWPPGPGRVGTGGASRNGVRGFYIFKTLTNLFLKSEPLGFFQFKEVTKDSKG